MDLMAEINAFLTSPEQQRAKRARREARAAMVYDRVGLALGKPSAVDAHARSAAAGGGWNMPVDGENSAVDGGPIGSQHPGAAALLVVRAALGEYSLPTNVELRYSGMKRASGHGAFAIDEGIIMVEATLHSMSGPRHHVDVPVVVREGRLLVPSILLHNGNKRVMAQSTFDDILGMGEFKANMPDRPNMYSPAPDKGASGGKPRQVPLLHPGMYSVAPARKLIQGALRGFHVESAVSPNAVAQHFLYAYEHDIKKGEFSGWEEVESSIRDQAAVTFMRDAIPSGFRSEHNREAIIAEARAFADEVVTMVVTALREDIGDDDFAKQAGPKDWLAGGALALGLMGQPGMAQGQPGSYDPSNQGVHQTNTNVYPQGKGEAVNKATDPGRDKERASVDAEMKALMQKYKGSKLTSYFKEGYMLSQENAPKGAFNKKLQSLNAGNLKQPLPEQEALKDGKKYNDLMQRQIELESLKKDGGRRHGFYEPDVTGLVENGSLGKDTAGAGNSHLDMAERPMTGMLGPGQSVRLKTERIVRDRGGVTYKIPKGSRGTVVRDVDGANWAYYVKFEELGFSATVPRLALA